MELSILLAEQIFSLLLMVLTGYVVRKLNVVPKSGRKVLASIVLYVSAPCIVFDSFQIEYSSEKSSFFHDLSCNSFFQSFTNFRKPSN